MATVSTASEMDLLHNKQRHNKSRGRLKTATSGDQPLLLDTWTRSTGRGSQDNTLEGGGATSILMAHNQYGGNYCNGTDR